jgi:hypothetical protein
LKKPKIETDVHPNPQLVMPSSSTIPVSGAITQLDPKVTVKEELDFFPTARSNTNLARIARLLASQLDEQAPPIEAQKAEFQAQISALTVKLKEQATNWEAQLEQKDAELE